MLEFTDNFDFYSQNNLLKNRISKGCSWLINNKLMYILRLLQNTKQPYKYLHKPYPLLYTLLILNQNRYGFRILNHSNHRQL